MEQNNEFITVSHADSVQEVVSALANTRQVLQELPEAKILVLMVHESKGVGDVLTAGAKGYLFKSDAARALINKLESGCQCPQLFATKAPEMPQTGHLALAKHHAKDSSLSPRETQIVQLLAEGNTNREIAKLLGIGVRTVDTHRKNIMRKMNFSSIADLVRYAIRCGIVAP